MVYSKVAQADQRITAEALDDGRIQIDFEPLYGTYAYQLGQIEGIVAYWETEPTVDIFRGSDEHLRLIVDLG